MRSRRQTRTRLGVLVGAVLVAAASVACSAGGATEKQTPTTPSDFVMPDVVGLYWVDADFKLRSAGWTGALVKESSVPVDPKNRNRVISQDPPAGQKASHDVIVRIRFGE